MKIPTLREWAWGRRYRPVADIRLPCDHGDMILAALLAVAVSAHTKIHWRPVPPETARVWLGFTGATLSIRSTDDPKRPGTAHRRMTLALPSGAKRSLPLEDGGGYAHNNSLNLYFVGHESFVLVSEKDCVRIDAFKATFDRCHPSQTETKNLVRVGRFDWMNAFDPPHGTFGFAFRFLPAWDA